VITGVGVTRAGETIPFVAEARGTSVREDGEVVDRSHAKVIREITKKKIQ
jgi:hypothetical protein